MQNCSFQNFLLLFPRVNVREGVARDYFSHSRLPRRLLSLTFFSAVGRMFTKIIKIVDFLQVRIDR